MRYLALALYAEGASDHAFLPRILYRSIFEIAARMSEQPVEIAEQFVRGNSARLRRHVGRAANVEMVFGAALSSLDILFIHADAGADAALAHERSVTPCCVRLRENFPDVRFKCVGVVPIRETEAWIVADADAVRRALGTNKSAAELGLPERPRDAERLADPKNVLRAAQRAAIASSRRLGRRIPSIHAILGETVRLPRLRGLTGFAAFEARAEAALRELWGLQ